ncbi:hypothetical protein U1763_00275 [Sphingomonas sp. LB2R24]|uniref:hypothetical protein n=1 Tax=Sphingomonas sorbitolis TaxID=3096165 RepID=UPI002FC77FCB
MKVTVNPGGKRYRNDEGARELTTGATALTVLGPDGLGLADDHGIAARLVAMIDGQPQEYVTPALAEMIDA